MPHTYSTTPTCRIPASLTRRLVLTLSEGLTRRHERHLLARLDKHLVRDIGLTHQDVQAECAKPFWRP